MITEITPTEKPSVIRYGMMGAFGFVVGRTTANLYGL